MIRVLVAHSSRNDAGSISRILSSDTDIEVIAVARDGEAAVRAAESLRPDVVVIDVKISKVDTFEAAGRIMAASPTPIVVVSAKLGPSEAATTFHAMESGALTVVERPPEPGGPDFARRARELVSTVKLMSNADAASWWARRRRRGSRLARPSQAEGVRLSAQTAVVAIGASAGGPLVLQGMLAAMPRDIGVPLLIVQHIAAGFTTGFVAWLRKTSALPVHVPSDGQVVAPGQVYLAPEDRQMGMRSRRRLLIGRDPAEDGARPSISYLFRSVAEACGGQAVGVLLTGMGRDGASGLASMKEMGATTIVQDEASSLVHGMPAKAVESGAVDYVLSPEQIVGALSGLGSGREAAAGGR